MPFVVRYRTTSGSGRDVVMIRAPARPSIPQDERVEGQPLNRTA
jgi:hypothetical protein